MLNLLRLVVWSTNVSLWKSPAPGTRGLNISLMLLSALINRSAWLHHLRVLTHDESSLGRSVKVLLSQSTLSASLTTKLNWVEIRGRLNTLWRGPATQEHLSPPGHQRWWLPELLGLSWCCESFQRVPEALTQGKLFLSTEGTWVMTRHPKQDK